MRLEIDFVSRKCLPKIPLARQRSAAWLLGDSEAVSQHLETNDFTAGDGEHNRKVRLDDLAGSLEVGRERTKDHRSILTRQNVVNLEADSLDHGARTVDDIGDRGPAGLFSDLGQNAGIARDFPLHVFSEQVGDLGRFSAAAHAAQKLLREVYGSFDSWRN